MEELSNKMPVLQGQNVGAVAIEQERAIAEAQGEMILAKKFPRDLNAAYSDLMESCKLQSLASVAFYSVPRGGGQVSGPSIRLAEEIARVCGNIKFGHRELSRTDTKSEIEVYARDVQTNTTATRQLTVMHVIDTKYGPKPCRDQREIDDLIANKASKQLRGRILAIVPKWLVEAAIGECKKTIAGGNDEPLSAKARKLAMAFAKYGIKNDHIEKYLGHGLDEILLDEYVELVGIGNALKDGKKASDYFGSKEERPPSGEKTELDMALIGAADSAPVIAPPKQKPAPMATEKPAAPETTAVAPATEPPKTTKPSPQAKSQAELPKTTVPTPEPAPAKSDPFGDDLPF